MKTGGYYLYLCLTLLFISGCGKEKVPDEYRPSTAHEAYGMALREFGLSESAMGADWIEASHRPLNNPVQTILPYKETFYFDPSRPESVGYRFFVKRGQRIEIHVLFQGMDSARVFMDLFRESQRVTNEWMPIASAPEQERRLLFEPRKDAWYILRIQPELLRGGRFEILIRQMPTLHFPVSGKNQDAIQSFFNDPRDGGTRDHHGVDIFSARHTPIIAPSEVSVQTIGSGNIGGNFIWLFDSKAYQYLYFAHLQDVHVSEYQSLKRGDTIGTVGNSGNAISTAPHLHFGIYIPGTGPVDPFPYIAYYDTLPGEITGHIPLNQTWRTNAAVMMHFFIRGTGDMDTLLPKYTPVSIMGRTPDYFRVALPNRLQAQIPAHCIEELRTIEKITAGELTLPVFESPYAQVIKQDALHRADTCHILGIFNHSYYIQINGNRTGWIRMDTN